MHIELIDLLRCPREHEETWLVAALNAVQDRFVLKAKLGCPVCGASYSISNGVADLRVSSREPSTETRSLDSESAVRIAALLNLSTPHAVAIVEGPQAAFAQRISDMTEGRVIALNPSVPVDDSETVATVLCDSRIPFASDTIAGVAGESADVIHDIPRVLRQGGRALLPVNSSIPTGLLEIARDQQSILAESVGAMVKLRR
jgi:uncharacterized protein YbaR (Trm112 family)